MRVSFQKLWNSHPAVHGENHPCKNSNGAPTYQSQCAIKLSIALAAAGVNMRLFHGRKCHQHGHPVHALGAQQLAGWLAHTGVLGRPHKFKRGKNDNKFIFGEATLRGIQKKKGVVFFMNFWGDHNQGDHIDVWDGQKMGHGQFNYFERSQQVWFWEIK